MKSIIKKWIGITALEARADASEKKAKIISEYLDKKIAELDKLTREDWDIGARGPSTIILTGVYRGRGYVKFYEVPGAEFDALVEEFQSRRRAHLIRNVDAPHFAYQRGAFNL